jgi:hypothetical protein
MARLQQPEHVARPHDRARPDDGAQRLVGGAQAVVVVDRHHAPPADRPGEHDGARAGGEHGPADAAHEVDAPVAAPVRVRRGAEPSADRGHRQERPRVPRPRRRDPGPVGRRRHLQHRRPVGRCRGAAGRWLPRRGRFAGSCRPVGRRWLPRRSGLAVGCRPTVGRRCPRRRSGGLRTRRPEARRPTGSGLVGNPSRARSGNQRRNQHCHAEGAHERATHPPRPARTHGRHEPGPPRCVHRLRLTGTATARGSVAWLVDGAWPRWTTAGRGVGPIQPRAYTRSAPRFASR